MSRADVLRSLLRSTARGAQEGLRKLPLAGAVQRLIGDAASGRAPLTDVQLTAEVARVPGVSAARVQIDERAIRVHASFGEGDDVALTLRPAAVQFAAGGAKEVSFVATPPGSAGSSRSRDVVGALGGAIARRLWAPALAGAPRSSTCAPASTQDDRLYVDLRSVPEVRWAQGRRVPAAVIEALSLKGLTLAQGQLVLQIHVPALEQLR